MAEQTDFESMYREQLDNLGKISAVVMSKDKFSRQEKTEISKGLLSCLGEIIQLNFIGLSQLALEPSRNPQAIAQQLDAMDTAKIANNLKRIDMLYKLLQDVDALYLRKEYM